MFSNHHGTHISNTEQRISHPPPLPYKLGTAASSLRV